MARDQLNIRLPPDLLERVRTAADEAGLPAASLVRKWIEAALDGRLAASSSLPSNGLADRLAELEKRQAEHEAELAEHGAEQERRLAGLELRRAELERRLAELELPRPATLEGVLALPMPTPFPRPRPAAPVPPPAEGEALSTPQLVALVGGVPSAWNSWAQRHSTGDVREWDGASFELLGQVPSGRGGPRRWMWRRVG